MGEQCSLWLGSFEEFAVGAGFAGQIGVASFLNDFPPVEDQNAVRYLYCGKTMRDHDRRFSACEASQRVHQLGFGHGIEPVGRLIHN